MRKPALAMVSAVWLLAACTPEVRLNKAELAQTLPPILTRLDGCADRRERLTKGLTELHAAHARGTRLRDEHLNYLREVMRNASPEERAVLSSQMADDPELQLTADEKSIIAEYSPVLSDTKEFCAYERTSADIVSIISNVPDNSSLRATLVKCTDALNGINSDDALPSASSIPDNAQGVFDRRPDRDRELRNCAASLRADAAALGVVVPPLKKAETESDSGEPGVLPSGASPKTNLQKIIVTRAPRVVGECNETTVKKVDFRLEDTPDTGSAVAFSNGLFQVSNEQIPEVDQSNSGDEVLICLTEVPTGCPAGDTRGWVYSAKNRRTGGSWELPNSSHECGGA